MENLLMEMVMTSARRDRTSESYPHHVDEIGMKHPRSRRALNRRRASRPGPRVEPRLRIRRGHGAHGRQGGLVAAFRKLLRLQ